MVAQIAQTETDDIVGKVSQIVVSVIAGIAIVAIAWFFEGSRKPLALFFGVIILAGGVSALIVRAYGALPDPIVIENNTTYVQSPNSIQDPNLKAYETQKMGFEQDWVKNSGIGMALLFGFGFALTNIINIESRKHGLVFYTYQFR